MPFSLDNEGAVLIASSSGIESSHESDAIRGSFFTHYVVAGPLGSPRGENGTKAPAAPPRSNGATLARPARRRLYRPGALALGRNRELGMQGAAAGARCDCSERFGGRSAAPDSARRRFSPREGD